ncbi:MAG: ribonuclease H-like domain-containing protein [Anaerolineae bacterium]|nr:ribonuclease H-like domain-containing protein [Anaerolineae bacterium]
MMSERYLLFDMETEYIQGSLNLDSYVPQITVAATLTSDDDLQLWCERDGDSQVSGASLTEQTAQSLVQYLADMNQSGYTIVTWNGAGFDFRVLANASGLKAECIDLAWRHTDMMFWFHCLKGFSIQLAKAAEAVGSSKTTGISGADAPRLWMEGQYDLVLQYVAQDVRATEAVYTAALNNQGIQWRTSYGRMSKASGNLLTVRDSFKLPEPDTSWMKRKPWPRSKFVGWMV